jgi:DNA polymerase-4
VGRTVNLKVRYGDFTTITRQESLGHPTDEAGEIYAAAGRLLEAERAVNTRAVRLLGVGVTALLRRTQMNLDLFVGPPAKSDSEGPDWDDAAEAETD